MQTAYDAGRHGCLRARALMAVAGILLLSIGTNAYGAKNARQGDAQHACRAKSDNSGKSTWPSQKPRMILSNDGEVDDMNSFIRILYYSNEVDIAGIILTSSIFHYAGNGDSVAPFRWTGQDWIPRYLDHYEAIRPNLIKHARGYPTAEHLRSLYKIGNITNVGEMTQVTEGSEWIKNIVLDDDPRTLNIQAWGGLNTAARALKSIEELCSGTADWPALVEKINKKVVIYNILNQDNTLTGYIQPHWPGIRIINNQSQFWSFAYAWSFGAVVPAQYKYVLQAPWMDPNLLNGTGPLMAEYRTYRDNKPTPGDDQNNRWRPDQNLNFAVHDFISEGDSPAFMYLFDFNGLRSSEDPTWGGWGGRFAPDATGWMDTCDPPSPCTGGGFPSPARALPLVRWFPDLQNDFASRVAWGVAEHYVDANHPPTVAVLPGWLDIKANSGKRIYFAAFVFDSDRDVLTTKWWQYAEAGSYPGTVTITSDPLQAKQNGHRLGIVTASIVVPGDAQPGQTIHVIAQVNDDVTPPITRYARFVVTVAD